MLCFAFEVLWPVEVAYTALWEVRREWWAGWMATCCEDAETCIPCLDRTCLRHHFDSGAAAHRGGWLPPVSRAEQSRAGEDSAAVTVSWDGRHGSHWATLAEGASFHPTIHVPATQLLFQWAGRKPETWASSLKQKCLGAQRGDLELPTVFQREKA